MAKIEVYSTDYCPYCDAAKALLQKLGQPYDDIDVSGQPEKRAWLVEQTGGRQTVPQIFINGTAIGGFTELRDLVKKGDFDRMIAE